MWLFDFSLFPDIYQDRVYRLTSGKHLYKDVLNAVLGTRSGYNTVVTPSVTQFWVLN